jgi:hypothetical protein
MNWPPNWAPFWARVNPLHAKAFEELNGASDRAAAIVGAAFVDDRLTELVEKQFINDDAHEHAFRKLLKEPEAPLAAFGAKINFAFASGLISKQGWEDLRWISKIRN